MDTIEVKSVAVGDACTFVDAHGQHHAAIVTAVWGEFYDTPTWTEEQSREHFGQWTRPDYYSEEEWEARIVNMVGVAHTVPSVNVVYATGDDAKTDPYGRQIERATSVVHKTLQAAHGMYWY